jgi:hypothetical protein
MTCNRYRNTLVTTYGQSPVDLTATKFWQWIPGIDRLSHQGFDNRGGICGKRIPRLFVGIS